MPNYQPKVQHSGLFSSGVLISLIVGAILIWLIFSLKSILMPFVLAMIFAYLLDPVVSIMQRKYNIPRGIGAIIAVITFFIFMALALLTISPMLITQSKKMIDFLSVYAHKIDTNYWTTLFDKMYVVSPEISGKIEQGLADFSTSLVIFAANLLQNVLQSGIMAINIISFVFITPIITFYITRDWPAFIRNIFLIIPKKYRKDFHTLMNSLDDTLSCYLRGQLLVCFILGVYYSISLTILGVESSLVLGMMSGFLTFIPYIGAIFSGAFTLLVTALQFGCWNQVMIAALIFMVGQFIEGSVLTPNLIGSQVGLHPVWVMFGLLAGGVLFGFFGILIAVPLTAIIGVVVKFTFKKYLSSSLYQHA